MKYLRFIIGKILLLINSLTLPTKIKREQEDQKEVIKTLKNYSLYQYLACPFCIKVRRTLHRLDLPMEKRDAKIRPYKEELLNNGGKVKVPCLRIEESSGTVKWLYESKDIIHYLDQKFGL